LTWTAGKPPSSMRRRCLPSTPRYFGCRRSRPSSARTRRCRESFGTVWVDYVDQEAIEGYVKEQVVPSDAAQDGLGTVTSTGWNGVSPL